MRARACGTLSIMRAERGHQHLHQRLVRQHEHAVVRGFADGAEEIRRLLDGDGVGSPSGDDALRVRARSAGLRWRAAAAAIGGSSAVSASQMS